jgi:polyribonucleotide nucleotidyltransferase
MIAGIAIGLVTSEEGDKHELVTDMADKEDFFGDMDFKVAGSRTGVTAIQMDNKLKGVKLSILKEALVQANLKRLELLDKMESVIKTPKAIGEFAPKVSSTKINVEKIGELIGPGGKNIKKITELSGAEIDIQEDGMVYVSAVDKASIDKAMEMIELTVGEAEVGKIYKGVVDSVKEYGAFVEVGGWSGLVHVSEMSDTFVKDPSTIVKVGDEVDVLVKAIDDQGKVSLSMKGVKPQKETL